VRETEALPPLSPTLGTARKNSVVDLSPSPPLLVGEGELEIKGAAMPTFLYHIYTWGEGEAHRKQTGAQHSPVHAYSFVILAELEKH
jgi:hypothetical protein